MFSNSAIVQVVHKSTGEVVRVYVDAYRSQHKTKEMAIKLLRSRLYARSKGINRSETVISSYELPDDVLYPSRLWEYRD